MAEKEIYPVRFNEITNLIAHMLGEDYDTVAQMVYNTDIGKAINLNREDILYEQVTDNVLSVVKELGQKNPKILKVCTPENITREYLNTRKTVLPTKKTRYKRSSDLKRVQKARIREQRKKRGVFL